MTPAIWLQFAPFRSAIHAFRYSIRCCPWDILTAGRSAFYAFRISLDPRLSALADSERSALARALARAEEGEVLVVLRWRDDDPDGAWHDGAGGNAAVGGPGGLPPRGASLRAHVLAALAEHGGRVVPRAADLVSFRSPVRSGRGTSA
jgi:hypothetical protein